MYTFLGVIWGHSQYLLERKITQLGIKSSLCVKKKPFMYGTLKCEIQILTRGWAPGLS